MSATELRAQITPPLLRLERGEAVEVEVVNPPPGGGSSEAASFRIDRGANEGTNRP